MNDSLKVASRSVRAKIGPSILNADLSNLVEECDKLVKNGADYLHLDVMDGHFVPNLTFGHPLVKCLRAGLNEKKLNPKPLFDMHMMVAEPEKWIQPMHEAGADLYTFHYEATKDRGVTEACIRAIKETGMQVGIGIKPKTAVDEIVQLVEDKKVDMVLIMTVEPGFGGQSFMTDMMPKVERLRKEFPWLNIEVDGGVSSKTIDAVSKAGANLIVSGTGVVKAKDQRAEMTTMRDQVDRELKKLSCPN